MANIFSGIKVIDVTKVFSGPFATRMLADYGAEVIKIESEKNFDDSRSYPPLRNGWSGYYEILNRNKKGISLNLKDPDDLQTLYGLAADADIFVENLTPSTKFKLKIDYDTLKKINPKIIYASLSGLGQDTDKRYYDVIAQAQSGLMALSGYPNEPMKIGPSVIDAFSGMTLAFGIASALFHRERSGTGQYLDISMLACAMNLLEGNLIEYSVTKKNPVRAGRQDTAIAPFGVFRAKDGFIVIAAGNDTIWTLIKDFLNEYTHVDDELYATNELRLKNLQHLTGLIESVFSQYPVTDLERKLVGRKIPCTRVYEMSDVYADEHNYTSGSLLHFNHDKLGECVVPGKSINFSEGESFVIKKSPQIGDDDTHYGI
jgi:crotonobetainyl-CoA:carnitine CoA-transferase CaiB-like acyl-CoA transferase